RTTQKRPRRRSAFLLISRLLKNRRILPSIAERVPRKLAASITVYARSIDEEFARHVIRNGLFRISHNSASQPLLFHCIRYFRILNLDRRGSRSITMVCAGTLVL